MSGKMTLTGFLRTIKSTRIPTYEDQMSGRAKVVMTIHGIEMELELKIDGKSDLSIFGGANGSFSNLKVEISAIEIPAATGAPNKYENRTCQNCDHKGSAIPCDTCEGPIGFWSPQMARIESHEPVSEMGYAGDFDAPYDPAMDDR